MQKEKIQESVQQAAQHVGEFSDWASPVMQDALREEAGLELGPEGGPELTDSQRFGSEVAQFAVRHTRDRARAWAEKRRQGDAPSVSEADMEETSLLTNAKDKASRFVSWLKPAAADALHDGTGVDAYDFMGKQQPELSRDQRFASKALSVGAAVFVARMAARAAAAAA